MSETATRERAPWATREWVTGTRADRRLPVRQSHTPPGPSRRKADGDVPVHDEILSRATMVLGSREAAKRWLQRPAIGLGNRRPIDLLAAPDQAALVDDLLTRIEYGVYT